MGKNKKSFADSAQIYSSDDVWGRLKDYDPYIVEAAKSHGVDPDALRSVMVVENLQTVGKPIGRLGQIKDDSWTKYQKKYGLTDGYNDRNNRQHQANMAAYILKDSMDTGKRVWKKDGRGVPNWIDAARIYNGGGDPNYREKIKYVYNLIAPKKLSQVVPQLQQPVMDTGFDYDSQYYG